MRYEAGALVKARGREWVVLSHHEDDMLMAKPIGGTDTEIAGIYLPIEKVESASFGLPDPSNMGDYRSCSLLRDAVRLGIRSSAGPFRSFAGINVEPRPYQLVPLLMALKLNPVRLLIADDVGIGKTIEACLIAKEFLDRKEIQRMAVLCPPQLAEQWQKELMDKFHIEAELVLSSTASKLERNLGFRKSLFEVYPYVIVSTDFIKSDNRRDEFLRACPEFVIVDEAHTFSFGYQERGGRHQRHQLLKGLSQNQNRHIIMVTATPHSGKEENFRSLLGFLNEEFLSLPDDLSGEDNVKYRKKLAENLIQRRRADIRHYMAADTPFPTRDESIENEIAYRLSSEYKDLFDKVLKYARDSVKEETGKTHRQRVRWWAVLSLLRALSSSPAAAAATLRIRARSADTDSIEAADEVGYHTVLDIETDETSEGIDIIPGSDVGEFADDENKNRQLLLKLAKEAEELGGEKDEKLKQIIKITKETLNDGYSPIIFCRFIDTAEYIAEHLKKHLSKVAVAAVTGLLSPHEREERIAQLAQSSKKVLVATDCLSEGINLQEHFNAVIHYDLSWNPTRHEQREGRVDRFGQPKEKVCCITMYGVDNRIDGIVLEILIKKHKSIKNSLGISVPVPIDTNTVIEAIFEGLLVKERHASGEYEQVLLFKDLEPQKEKLYKLWDNVSLRESRSRTMFAQETIKVGEVEKELNQARTAAGSSSVVENFVKEGLKVHDALVSQGDAVKFNLKECPKSLKDMLGENYEEFKAKFTLPAGENVIYIPRTHPVVENLSSFIFNSSLDPLLEGRAKRCGVIKTKLVNKRTTIILSRIRYNIITSKTDETSMAEECHLLAFSGSPQNPEWLDSDIIEKIIVAAPDENINQDQASDFIRKVVEDFSFIMPKLEEEAKKRAQDLLSAHTRVRESAKIKSAGCKVEPLLPVDVIGIYVYLPVMPVI